jgi:hypothetical protein
MIKQIVVCIPGVSSFPFKVKMEEVMGWKRVMRLPFFEKKKEKSNERIILSGNRTRLQVPLIRKYVTHENWLFG